MRLDTKKILAENITALLKRYPDTSRLNLSKRMGVADGSIGRMKYGTGNPTLDVLEGVARFFNVEVWQLFVSNGVSIKTNTPPEISDSISPQTLELIQRIAELDSNDSCPPQLMALIENALDLAQPPSAPNTSRQDSARVDPNLEGLAALYLKDPKSLSKESFALLNKQLARHTDNLESSESDPLATEQQKKETGS